MRGNAAMLLAANPANADLEHHVELLQTGEHQMLSSFRFSFGWVACDRRE